MKFLYRFFLLMLVLAMPLSGYAQERQEKQRQQQVRPNAGKSWKRILGSTDAGFFTTDEARRIGDQVIAYQRVTGGWAKNIDIVRPLSEAELAQVLKDKSRTDDSTTDNGSTNLQLNYLARLYQATKDAKYRDAYVRGVEYLLSGQYPNGGWPQFWPNPKGYQIHITYNDDAMINTLTLFLKMVRQESPYNGDLSTPALRKRMQKAIDKAVDIILKTQIVSDGKLTVWCQQHDRETLQPAKARAYELPSYCSMESATIVQFLMSLDKPMAKMKQSIHGAMAWFDKYKITGYRVKRTYDALQKKANTLLVEDSTAKPIWARYYDLDHCEPYVCDRDGLPRRSLEQIGEERRNGYSWYGGRPLDLYSQYSAWADKYDPKHKVQLSPEGPGANENGTITMFRQPEVDEAMFDAVVRRGESIQQVIDKAPADCTLDNPYKIFIKTGVYREKIIIDKPNIMLVGEKRDSCIISGAETELHRMPTPSFSGKRIHHGILVLTDRADDCIISGLTIINNYGTTVHPTTTHQMTVYGNATRTIIINCNINSDGNDALSLWAKKDGMYYHADLYMRCPGVDFICPRGTCYATRCSFYGDSRAILWHDGRNVKSNKFVVTNSKFDGRQPTVLGRYHHDSQFYIINCHMTENIIDRTIEHAYKYRKPLKPGEKKTADTLAQSPADPCPWGQRVYFYGCHRDGGDSGWLKNNLHEAEGSPEFHGITALWTFDGKWDPELRIRTFWKYLAY